MCFLGGDFHYCQKISKKSCFVRFIIVANSLENLWEAFLLEIVTTRAVRKLRPAEWTSVSVFIRQTGPNY